VKTFMCDECARLQTICAAASNHLEITQRDLASYRNAEDQDARTRLWKESEDALRTIWALREEMAQHASTHVNGSTPKGLNASA
jgi:hypothetical protein